jgi:hypothetical protein
MSPDDIQFFDIGTRVVVKIGETGSGEVRFMIVTIADVIFITGGNSVKVQKYLVKFTTKYDDDTDWYDACDVFKNIDSLMESIKQNKNK